MEERQDDDFGFVRRDTDVLRRAIESEGSRAGSDRPPPTRQEPEAGSSPAPASGGGDSAQQQQQVRAPAVAPQKDPSTTTRTTVGKSVGKAAGLLKKMSVSGSGPPSSAPKEDDLPQSFQVKYLGSRDARGLWGIKHTRRPVDALVTAAKSLPPGVVLPMVRLTVTREGVVVGSLTGGGGRLHAIDTISYGVQDLVYTRVFSMIVVREASQHHHPFECHAFVCDSRASARRLTYSLAAAFNEYSKVVRASGGGAAAGAAAVRKKFAIDLRTPEEIEAELNSAPHEADSEA